MQSAVPRAASAASSGTASPSNMVIDSFAWTAKMKNGSIVIIL